MRAALLAALLVAGCAEIGLVPNGVPAPPPPRPVLRDPLTPSVTFSAGLIAHRKVDGLRVKVFVVGEGQVRGSYLSELKSPDAHLKPPVMVVMVQHPQQGVILFGSGLPEDLGGLGGKVKGAALSPFRVKPGGDILSQLAGQAIKPEDVKWVVLPDLAPEWAGRAGVFPNATVLVSAQNWFNPKRKELEADLPDPRAFVPEERLKIIDFSHDSPYGPFARGRDLFADGTLILVDLEGGVAGGMGLWVNLDSGPLLLAGPAAFVYDNIYDSALPDRRFVVDVSSFAWNTRAMRLAQDAVPRLVIAPSHDLSTLKLSPRPDILLVP